MVSTLNWRGRDQYQSTIGAPADLEASCRLLQSARENRNLRRAQPPGRPAWSGGCVSRPRPLVSVVDDDESVRESLPDLLRELGFQAEAFSSAEEFLDSNPLGRTECLILDLSMPGMSGPELQRELSRRGAGIPIIF